MTRELPCPFCGGHGETDNHACEYCGGFGTLPVLDPDFTCDQCGTPASWHHDNRCPETSDAA